MPIRPELRAFYSSLEWKAIRARILARARGLCEQCSKPDRRLVWVIRDGSARWWLTKPAGITGPLHRTRCVLTIAHLNHDHEDNRDENLAALCQRCHLAHDQRFHYANRRRKAAAANGQAWLSPEIQHANQGGEAFAR